MNGRTGLVVVLALFIALQVGDALTTVWAIKTGRGKEANPIMDWWMGRMGTIHALVQAKVALLLVALLAVALCPGPAFWILLALSAFYAVVIFRNYRIASGK
jgi:hypothetical protein